MRCVERRFDLIINDNFIVKRKYGLGG